MPCRLIPFSVVIYTVAGGLKATFTSSYLHTVRCLAIPKTGLCFCRCICIPFGLAKIHTVRCLAIPVAIFSIVASFRASQELGRL